MGLPMSHLVAIASYAYDGSPFTLANVCYCLAAGQQSDMHVIWLLGISTKIPDQRAIIHFHDL